MDTYEAAQILGVAAYEVTSVEQDSAGNWIAVHEDYASHVTTRRALPVSVNSEAEAREEHLRDREARADLVPVTDEKAGDESGPDGASEPAGDQNPDVASDPAAPGEASTAKKRTSMKKAGTDDNAGA